MLKLPRTLHYLLVKDHPKLMHCLIYVMDGHTLNVDFMDDPPLEQYVRSLSKKIEFFAEDIGLSHFRINKLSEKSFECLERHLINVTKEYSCSTNGDFLSWS